MSLGTRKTMFGVALTIAGLVGGITGIISVRSDLKVSEESWRGIGQDGWLSAQLYGYLLTRVDSTNAPCRRLIDSLPSLEGAVALVVSSRDSLGRSLNPYDEDGNLRFYQKNISQKDSARLIAPEPCGFAIPVEPAFPADWERAISKSLSAFALALLVFVPIAFGLSYPDEGWRRLSIVTGLVSAGATVAWLLYQGYRLNETFEQALVLGVVGIAAPGLARDLYLWVRRGFGTS